MERLLARSSLFCAKVLDEKLWSLSERSQKAVRLEITSGRRARMTVAEVRAARESWPLSLTWIERISMRIGCFRHALALGAQQNGWKKSQHQTSVQLALKSRDLLGSSDLLPHPCRILIEQRSRC
jgi:hypothetical protein